MNRAYAVITLKSVDDAKRTFTGIATTPSADRMGDVVEPKGAKFKLPIPLLWQHDSWQPIGWVKRARVSKDGIEIEGEVADVADAGVLKDRLAEAWQSLKSGLVRGLSIGFTPLDMEPIDAKVPWGPMKFIAWEWLELSAVTIAANQDASITAIKSIDERLRLAAPGRTTKVTTPTARAGASLVSSPKGNSMKTYTQEALAGLQSTRETKAKRMEELRELKSTENRRFTEEERIEFEALDADIEDLDDEIRVSQRHLGNISRAKAVNGSESGSRGAPYGYVKRQDPDDKFKGQAGTRMIIAKAAAVLMAKEGIYLRPSDIAEQRWGKTHPMLVAVMKANEVPGGGSGSGEWGAELVTADGRFTGDFVEYLYSLTVFDKLPLREIPANVTVKGQDGQGTGYWVGQSKAIPVTTGDFYNTTLTPLKVAALAVMSNELIRDSSPSAEVLVRDILGEAATQRIDTTFLSATAASAGVSPAGMLNGISAGVSNGGDAQSIITDFKALLANFITAKNLGALEIVTTPTLSAALGLMRNALGQPEFPGLTVRGGTFQGYPVVVGDNVGAGDFILLNPREIWKIGDLGVKISVSQEAMIEQSTAPTGETDTPVAASQAFTSMFQEESTAIKVVRPINFAKRRSTAVAYIGDAAYGTEQS